MLTPREAEEYALLEARAKRREIRSSLAAWSRLNGFEPAPHHELLIQCLESAARERNSKFIFCLPRGAAKSTYGSKLFPPWALADRGVAGWQPRSILAASHNKDLIQSFGRDCRNRIDRFPRELGYALRRDSKAADEWATTTGKEYFCAGVGAGIAGHRGDLGIVDDYFGSVEDADSDLNRDRVWDWFWADFIGCLNPGASIIIIACMVGDTAVLMADGGEKLLRDVRSGDWVATYKDGMLGVSVVKNWTNSGSDSVLAIKTTCGTFKANKRHPFLVNDNGNLKWIRTRDLRRGHEIVRVNGESGRAKLARGMAVDCRPKAEVTACPTITKRDGLMGLDRLPLILSPDGWPKSSIGMGSRHKSTRSESSSRRVAVPCANSFRGRMFAPIGEESCALTTITVPERLEGCYATTATSLSVMPRLPRLLWPQQNISDFTLDEVLSIEPCGVEEVFDLQVEGTENFIANGVVSHNTRWHEDDLIGRLLKTERHLWNLISIPLIAKDGDPLGRAKGERLWPEHYDAEKERQARVEPRIFSAVWQQEPSPEDGDYFRKDALERCSYDSIDQLPKDLRAHVGSDHAISKREEADKTCMVEVGVDTSGVLWVLPSITWGKFDADVQVDRMFSVAQRLDAAYGSTWWVAEKEKITQCLGPYLFKKMRDEGHFFVVDQVSPKKDKRWRARSLQALVNAGQVRFPTFAPWWPDARRELLAFDNLGEDDFVDALAHVARKINSVQPAEEQRDMPEFLLKDPPPERGIRITMREIRDQMERKARETRVSAM